METEPGTVTVSKAFQEHLRQLCLHEFPCGLGSWNRTRFSPQNLKSWKGGIPKMPENVPPEEETVESLLRLVQSKKSPWAQHKDSTMEDQYLRELAIQNPLLIGDAFLFSYFTSLRVVNKGVTLIDEDLLKFLKLEELILSANHIREVDPMNLPPTLKVLELYGNEMTSIQCLCSHPPPALQHLGVGHNKLLGFLESQYITASYWPNLVSLDLGYNDLTELHYMIAGLCTLLQLRLLVLQGNPLALVPHYRGYTIDCLPQLYVLDDVTVSPEERHLFQGLSCKLGMAEEEAHLIVTVKNVTGILDSSVLDPEPTLEGPYIVYSYYVTYNFVEDEKDIGKEKEDASNMKEVMEPTKSPLLSTMLSRESNNETETDPRLMPAPGSVLFSTIRKPWTNIIEYDYKMKHTLKDLVPLKAFLLLGTYVTIVEEKIVSWQILPTPVESPPPVKTGKGEKDKDKKEKDKNKKGKDKDKKEKDKDKKKRDTPKEFRQDPPILRVLGSQLLSLEPFLSGETLVASLCNFGTVRTAETDKLTYIRDQKAKTKKKGAKRKVKDKDKKKESMLFEEPDYQPDPLTVDVQIQLCHYKSLAEALTPPPS
ncbi:leucine-rich repeat-containing protein 43 [Dromiciops gliroides]|uniref:leucine-rich repeat-containing protein 43 n=1 Tax=Dromiciops gliroides TaxID=33562 RepID=UPI001CC49739|nr:leucine-rich repeat-containing protein 43 [Dromiciops gliroides]